MTQPTKRALTGRVPQPPHPGAHIREEILRPYRLMVSEAADLLGVSRPTLSNLLNGNAALSGLMAIRIEKVFGVPMEPLMAMQAAYDIAQAKQSAAQHTQIASLQRYRPKALRRR